jgi:copper chaperone
MTEFTLPDMHCGGCAGKVTRVLQSTDPACTVEIDLPHHQVRVQSDTDRQLLAEALTAAGFVPA